jgi:polysaccharide export outer membrane protein
MRMRYRSLFLSLVICGVAVGQELKSHNDPYRIQPSDVLEVHYRYTPEFDQTVSVGPDGQASIMGILKEYVKPHIFVEGEVNSPGRVEMRGHLTALDAVALAGGFKNTGKASEVLLLRRDSNQTRVVNLQQLVKQRKLEEAPDLRSGDVIYVTQSGFSKFERIMRLGQFGAIYNPAR